MSRSIQYTTTTSHTPTTTTTSSSSSTTTILNTSRRIEKYTNIITLSVHTGKQYKN